LFLTVKVPVKCQGYIDNGIPIIAAVFISLTDGMTVYYVIYLLICIFGLVFNDFWTTFLLLDIIVKNGVCRNVLNSVVYPYKQLGMTLILGLFVAYIYAYLYYTYFAGDLYASEPITLFTFFITSWCWGLRSRKKYVITFHSLLSY
jgi:hypothetical protein